MEDAVRTYRRMAAVAVLGAVAAAALASCGLQPDKAASVGDTAFTEKQVDAAVKAAGGQRTRSQVVQDMVIAESCKQYAKANNVTYDAAAVAKQLGEQGLGAGIYQDVLATRTACMTAVTKDPAELAPTEAELHKLYDDVTKIDPSLLGTSFDQAKQQLLQNEQVTNAFAQQHAVTKVTKDQDISVNPRYRTLTMPLLATQGNDVVLKVDLGEQANPAVTDAPPAKVQQTQPPAGQQQQQTS
jgi:hypothetical protein